MKTLCSLFKFLFQSFASYYFKNSKKHNYKNNNNAKIKNSHHNLDHTGDFKEQNNRITIFIGAKITLFS